MRICAFSDMHGQLDFKIEPCDIVIICGDIIPLRIQSFTGPSEVWLRDVFIPWCTNLPCEKVLFIAGNHDFLMMRHPDRVRLMLKGQDKITYLDCETFEYKGKTIFGTPWCKPFGRWAFMESYEEQDKRYVCLRTRSVHEVRLQPYMGFRGLGLRDMECAVIQEHIF